jgi:hypothetical protein
VALGELILRDLLKGVYRAEIEWVMWISVSSLNAGQVRFLDFAEQRLGWRVRRFPPIEAYMLDPASTAGLTSEGRGHNRLIRFDASIAFAMGRMAPDHRLVVISDSFALAESLVRAARTANCTNAVVFFGRLLDPRWQRVLRVPDLPVRFIDLDEAAKELGLARVEEESAWTDDFLTR